jgi:hypothetical protein
MESRVAYITLITNDSFLPGVQALVKSLRKVSCQKNILVMSSKEGVSKSTNQAISSLGVEVIAVDNIPAPFNEHSSASSWTKSQYTKLNLWLGCASFSLFSL